MVVQVRVLGLALDEAGQHVLLVKPLGEPSGTGQDAADLDRFPRSDLDHGRAAGHTGPAPARPRPDASAARRSGAEVERVEITRIDEGTYYAEITLMTVLGTRTVDARPSDAVALATRVGAPIWVADEVMRSGIPDMTRRTTTMTCRTRRSASTSSSAS